MKKLILLITLLATMAALAGCGKKTVKLNDYITFTENGYDSMGTVSYEFDYDAFEEDYGDKIKLKKKTEDTMNDYVLEIHLESLDNRAPARILLNVCVDQILEADANLSNGDTVTLKWECNDTVAEEYFNVKLDYSDMEYKMKELQEVEKFNPFEYIDVNFSDISPDGCMVVTPDYDRPEMQYIEFDVSKINGEENNGYSITSNEFHCGLKNGDMVELSAKISGDLDSFVSRFGCVLGKTAETYECDGLAHYAEAADEIPENVLNDLVEHGKKIYKDEEVSRWDKPENFVSMEYKGNYFLKRKMDVSYGEQNQMYLVYEVLAKNPEPAQDVTVYYYTRYKDIVVESDGTCTINKEECEKPSRGFFFVLEGFQVGDYTYAGYDSLDSFYNSCILDRIDQYEYTENIDKTL